MIFQQIREVKNDDGKVVGYSPEIRTLYWPFWREPITQVDGKIVTIYPSNPYPHKKQAERVLEAVRTAKKNKEEILIDIDPNRPMTRMELTWCLVTFSIFLVMMVLLTKYVTVPAFEYFKGVIL